MKILLVPSSYLPVMGGVQSIAVQLAEGLPAFGHEVTVLTQRYPRELAASQVIDGVAVERFLFLLPRMQYFRERRPDLFLAGLFYAPMTLLRLLQLLVRFKPDVVNLHFVGAPAPFVWLTQRLLHFRLVVSLHGDDVEGLARRAPFDRWVFRHLLESAFAVTASSNYLLTQAAHRVPQIASKSRAIWSGVYLPDAPAATTGTDLMAFGRMIPKKGFDLLVRAMALLDPSEFSGKLVFFGDGPERSALESLARDLNVQARVEFRGRIPYADVIPTMMTSRAVVIPSRQEPLGLVALEAMAAGRPVIAARVGGLVETLGDADAVLVEPDNPQALADGIRAMGKKLQVNPDFGKRNHALVLRYSVAHVVARYEGVYRGDLAVD